MKQLQTIVAVLTCAFNIAASDYVITDYGITTDSTLIQTQKIQNVIDLAEINGGGRIVIPKGTFLSGALFFKPGTTLHLADGAVLKGSDNILDFPLLPSRMEGRNIYYYAALINAYNVPRFAITGSGTVNGNGHKYWADFWRRRDLAAQNDNGREFTNLEVHRPRLVFIWGCDNATLDGPTFCNSPFWTCHFYQCRNLTVKNCRMTTPSRPVRAPSSDCIDLDVCSNVNISNCFFNTDDDGVCIKGGKGVFAQQMYGNGPVDSVTVKHCIFGPNLHGTVTLGSECINANAIFLDSCTVNNNCAILRLKMRPDTPQNYSNIHISNITGRCGEIISMRPWTQFFTLEGTNRKPHANVSNILVENIDVACSGAAAHLQGNPDDKVTNITLRNINATATKDIHSAYKLNIQNMSIKTISGKAIDNPDAEFEK
ncbi:MAG: glycosyl hydrolase family 28 protein [Muribaculum sp.]|nr:glycosyl hydrolase family 28 protein [Muribaculaceae bacterium]MCM1080438.1 glycosyl hydrolase family 28 protein [Muribaculum sp.]